MMITLLLGGCNWLYPSTLTPLLASLTGGSKYFLSANNIVYKPAVVAERSNASIKH